MDLTQYVIPLWCHFLILSLSAAPIINILAVLAKAGTFFQKRISLVSVILGLLAILTFYSLWILGIFMILEFWRFFIYFAGCLNIVIGIGVLSLKSIRFKKTEGWVLTASGVLATITYSFFWLLGLIQNTFSSAGKIFIPTVSLLILGIGIGILLYQRKNKF